MRTYYLITSILLFFFISSCSNEERITDNRRVLFKGRLIDTEGMPVTNLRVETKTERSNLGSVLTDDNGNFKFTALTVSRNNVMFTVNDSDYYTVANPEFGTVQFLEARPQQNEWTFDFNEITIARRATFRIVTIPQEGTQDTLTYQLTYTSPECIKYLNEPEDYIPGGTADRCFSSLEFLKTKGPEAFKDSINLETSLYSDVILTYRINSGAQNQISIPVNTNLTRYEITY
ncbi:MULTISPECIES: hypothetical protein [unclassified Leeuwenhoekiella]|uniref:hypothetical protein n=1 Tax=unclassified Leeuwenhoekiella TaxID=2615029 RepID=UPI000C61B91E|nr:MULTISPECIES: hypothetical protein [unclassified Leeuwenhoekiella]MAW96048.1 hypothetical protein [Leeuwenhoekiella sp.]MBA80042.1 hypothetical protein [Leeuwenhoekiella sp.]|tara:strand:+ start:42156 stop:42851 length:696 start_codon:yes stop_codon:yes gene_type:complete